MNEPVLFIRMIGIIVVFFLGVLQTKSIKNNKTGTCYGIKILSYHGYSCFKHVSSINSSLLVFFTFISDKKV